MLYYFIYTMIIKSENDMIKLGEKLIKEKKIILLEWDLWAGKTTLTKGIAKGLHIDNRKIQSPTYAYMNVYDNKLLHIDMYRFESYEQVVEKWIIDEIGNYDYIVIERPKRIDQLPINNYYLVNIKKTSPTSREVCIEKG